MRIVIPQRDLRRAGCAERRTSGSGSGTQKPTGGDTGRALRVDFHYFRPWITVVTRTGKVPPATVAKPNVTSAATATPFYWTDSM
jgi:hypothetical protein